MIFDCDCSAEGEGPSALWEEWRTARKEHVCGECDEPINPGQQYEVAKGVWNGEFYTFKTCEVCVRIRDRFCPHGFIYGEVQELVSECVGFLYASDPATWSDE